MTSEEINRVLLEHFRKREQPLAPPSASDWAALQTRFNWEPPGDFRRFMEQVGEYWFEGGLLSISERNETPKRDTMVSVFESELAIGGWDVDLIPFYDVGNGDAYCVSRKNGCVQYVRHEDRFAEQIADSFEGWIKMIPNY